ncbi:MAG: YihA family ribosome biogenesis GTP-binding protein [Sandaracinus sp.]|nr:YihA family ribosome biogenesis GTP-binding protein [Sandaracinus sp.]MCB9610860.1 YihA family ribosome biogenesis GTP-binding protein [Sandaracinus sp.]MCB9623909.1 YihA family ribosome biogenesis GTP-binding protein [Sandaracinus sp.]
MEVLEAEFVAAASALPQLPAPVLAEVAFAGRSNVGKSSLINALTQRKKLVRTSSTPGATRGINLFRLKLRVPVPEGEPVLGEMDLVDLPGYGYAKRSKTERKSWGPLIESFLRTRPGLRAVVVIVDARRGPEEDDAELLEFLDYIERPALVVATKLDKLPKNQQKLAVEAVSRTVGRRVFGFSAETGQGREPLWRSILRHAHVGVQDED